LARFYLRNKGGEKQKKDLGIRMTATSPKKPLPKKPTPALSPPHKNKICPTCNTRVTIWQLGGKTAKYCREIASEFKLNYKAELLEDTKYFRQANSIEDRGLRESEVQDFWKKKKKGTVKKKNPPLRRRSSFSMGI